MPYSGAYKATPSMQLLLLTARAHRLMQTKRLKQNRLAAKKSRERRKEYVLCLEDQVSGSMGMLSSSHKAA